MALPRAGPAHASLTAAVQATLDAPWREAAPHRETTTRQAELPRLTLAPKPGAIYTFGVEARERCGLS